MNDPTYTTVHGDIGTAGWYVKAILTIIAACLAYRCVYPLPLSAVVHIHQAQVEKSYPALGDPT